MRWWVRSGSAHIWQPEAQRPFFRTEFADFPGMRHQDVFFLLSNYVTDASVIAYKWFSDLASAASLFVTLSLTDNCSSEISQATSHIYKLHAPNVVLLLNKCQGERNWRRYKVRGESLGRVWDARKVGKIQGKLAAAESAKLKVESAVIGVSVQFGSCRSAAAIKDFNYFQSVAAKFLIIENAARWLWSRFSPLISNLRGK